MAVRRDPYPLHRVDILAGDIVLTRGTSILARAIRWATQEDGEAPTRVNHVGLVVTPNSPHRALIVEALNKVRRHTLNRYADTDNEIAIYRPLNLGPLQLELILAYMEGKVGNTYGYGKVVLHALRKFGIPLLDKVEAFQVEEWPICSYLVAKAFDRVGLDFGVKAGMATPDDIYDFVIHNPDKYEPILGLQHVTH